MGVASQTPSHIRHVPCASPSGVKSVCRGDHAGSHYCTLSSPIQTLNCPCPAAFTTVPTEQHARGPSASQPLREARHANNQSLEFSWTPIDDHQRLNCRRSCPCGVRLFGIKNLHRQKGKLMPSSLFRRANRTWKAFMCGCVRRKASTSRKCGLCLSLPQIVRNRSSSLISRRSRTRTSIKSGASHSETISHL
jgi:hypothetical protein